MGVLGRIKDVAAQKKGEIDRGIAKEKRYQEYKNPDVAYITKGTNKSEDYEEAAEFASRQTKERERSAERKAAIKAKARRIGGEVRQKLTKAMKEPPRRPARQQNDNDMFGFGGGFDPMGRKAYNPLGTGKSQGFDLGFGKRGKQRRIELW